MWSCRFIFPLCLLLLLSTVLGCNYSLTTHSSTPLPSDIRNVFLERVENPTNFSWLEMRLRSELRDELNKQGSVVWSERKDAQGLLEVVIEKSRIGTKLEDSGEETVRSRVDLTLRARILRKKDHKLVWESGLIDIRESFPGDGREERDPKLHRARKKAVEFGVEELVSRLRNGF
ncbi:MAG: LPS assembly lipoprotein LptE [Thermodesulfobacteriota bacterium]